MSITQPGDVTVIAPIAVQNDANFAMRAESILGSYIALPSGSGPPTTTSIPSVVRRAGMRAFTPGDSKTWILLGGIADANWVEDIGGPITSVFGRTGAVVAALNDYTSSLVQNSSSVSGATVTAALNALNTAVGALVTGVSSVYGRTGAVVAASGDYTSTLITNSSSVAGATVTAALNTLLAALATAGPVSSVFGRTGAVVAALNDYTSSLVQNTSTVTGTTVTAALDNLKSSIAALVTGVSSFNTRTGAVVPASGDYTSTQITNSSGVTGATVTAALDALNRREYRAVDTHSGSYTLVAGDANKLIQLNANSAITVPSAVFTAGDQVDFIVTGGTTHTFAAGSGATLIQPASSTTVDVQSCVYELRFIGNNGSSDVFSLVQIANTQGSTAVTNQSTVTGTTVTAALDALKASITALVTGVSSFNTRTGAVVPASGDYTSTLVTNSSTVTGGTVTAALDALKSSIAALVTGVSSFNSRTGAVAPASGDYTSTQVTNSSTRVSGTWVTDAIDKLALAYSSVTTFTTSKTLALSDLRTLAVASGAPGAVTVTVPTNATVAFPIGSTVDFMPDTTVTALGFSPAAGVTIRIPRAVHTTAYALSRLTKINTNEWSLVELQNPEIAYTSTTVTNSSTVTGTTVTDALNTLKAASGVTSFNSRTGAVVPATNDYSTTQINNLSSVAGLNVTTALNSLLQTYPLNNFVVGSAGTFTLSTSNMGKVILWGASGAFTVSIPTFASSSIPVGTRFRIVQYTPGSTTAINPAAGVSIIGNFSPDNTSYTQYDFTHVAFDVWRVDTIREGKRSITRRISIASVREHSYWSFSPGVGLLSTGSGTSGTMIIPMCHVSDEEQITGIGVTLLPGGGHSVLPATMPTLRLYRSPLSAGPATVLATAVDTSSSVAAYESLHIVSTTFSPISTGFGSWWLEHTDESARPGTIVVDFFVTLNSFY